MLMKTSDTPVRIDRQQGITLIEVLITMVVVSIGLLGIAALQLKSMQFSDSSLQRSIAAVQANDLVERLWAGACELDDSSITDAIESDWQDAHEASNNPLPSWEGSLVIDTSGAIPIYEITIQWTDPRSTDGATEFVHYASIPVLDCGS